MTASDLLDLAEGPAVAYAGGLARALAALRLNQHFPPWQRLGEHLLRTTHGGLRVDRTSGLPVPRAWIEVRIDRELAGDELARLAAVDREGLPDDEVRRLDEKAARLQDLLTVDPLPARAVRVALRHVADGRASYQVRVDRFDLATATVARYTIVLSDRPGQRVSDGELELRASQAFRSSLELLSTQDAALAFAVLRAEGLDVEEVVRGVVGPAMVPAGDPVLSPSDPGCGPEPLRRLALGGPALSACLERASIDVASARVDDPLATTVVIPGEGQVFGISRLRKWAVPADGEAALRAWLSALGSRNLVYAF